MTAFDTAAPVGPTMDHAPTWLPLRRSQVISIIVSVICIIIVGWGFLPPGICFDDPGDLQVASATWGVAHPPGYVGYVTVGWILCKVFFLVEPARVVSITCLVCGVAALAMIMVLLVRMGLHVAAACGVGVLMVAHNKVWQNLVVPEVYAPSLLLLVSSAYFAIKFVQTGRTRDVLLSAGLFGFLVSQRAPSVLMAPAVVGPWLVGEWRAGFWTRRALKRGGVAVGVFAVVVSIVMALTWMRESPSTPHNSVQQYARAYGTPPAKPMNLADRVKRFTWLVTAREHRYLMWANWGQMRSKSLWIRQRLFVYEWSHLAPLLLLVAVGFVRLARRGAEWIWVCAGIIVGTLVFLMQFRVHGQAADLLPLLFALAVVLGAAFVPWLSGRADRGGAKPAIALLILAMVVTGYRVFSRDWDYAKSADATAYMDQLDFPTLPQGAVILAEFPQTHPFQYAKLISTSRNDIEVVGGPCARWADLARQFSDRVVYYQDENCRPPVGWRLRPARNVWRLVPADEQSSPADSALRGT